VAGYSKPGDQVALDYLELINTEDKKPEEVQKGVKGISKI